MKLHDTRVLLTGATGGMGQAIAIELARHGARIGLVGTREDALQEVMQKLRHFTDQAIAIRANITVSQDQQHIVQEMYRHFGGIDMLLNSAGISDFTDFETQDPAMIQRIFEVNAIAPMQLARHVLPDMLNRQSGQIVNIGSTFGSIAFACFTSYSASKFALRGFSQALRREVAGSGVKVTYIAPRAVRTPLNSDAVMRMAQAVKMNMDNPTVVAKKIVKAIEKDKKEVYLGFPESLFVRINNLLPGFVDNALRKQNRIMREFTQST